MSIAEKTRRHRAIVAVLRSQPVESQDALARALERRRIDVTQSTLSRDLKELGVARLPTEDGYRYVCPDRVREGDEVVEPGARRLGSLTGLEVTGIDANESVVVVRTLVGRASGVAVYLDSLDEPDLLATVAGDDTILAVPRSVKHAARLRRRLAAALGFA